MKHNFELDKQADVIQCSRCGYVRGEKYYQRCPMDINKIR
jgi:hypothetical protein